MNKPNLSEIGKIVREMTTDSTQAPGYNAAAAEIVKQGVIDKAQARLGYQTVLTRPLDRISPPKTL